MKKIALSILFGLLLSFPSFSTPIDDAEQLYKSGEYNRGKKQKRRNIIINKEKRK